MSYQFVHTVLMSAAILREKGDQHSKKAYHSYSMPPCCMLNHLEVTYTVPDRGVARSRRQGLVMSELNSIRQEYFCLVRIN